MSRTGSPEAGFALIGVLWVVAALASLLAVGLAPAVLAATAAENRMALMRSGWAVRACIALIQARHDDGVSFDITQPIALGPSTWCSAEPHEWDERVNPNLLDSAALMRVLGDTIAVASILDWIDADSVARAAGAEQDWYRTHRTDAPRNARFEAVAEVARVRGFETWDVADLERLFTVRGDGSVSPDRAPADVLRSVSTLDGDRLARLLTLRNREGDFESAEAVSIALGMEPTVEEFRELTVRLSIRPTARLVRVQGWTDAGERTLQTNYEVAMRLVDERLVVTSVELR